MSGRSQTVAEVRPSTERPPVDEQLAPLTTWEWFSFSVVRGAIVALRRMIGLGGLYQFGRIFGTLEYLVNYRRRRRFGRTVRRYCPDLPPAEVRRHTRAHFMQTRCDKLLYLILDTITPETASQLLTVERRDLFDEALASGRGVYFAYSHIGPIHLIAALMAIRGYRTLAVRERNEAPIRRFVQGRIDKTGAFERTRFVYADGFPREIYRCFQRGYLVGSLLDASRKRHPNQRTERVTLFDREVELLTGPLQVALRCGAPALQAFAVAESGFRYRFRIVEQFWGPNEKGANEKDAGEEGGNALIRRAVERYAANLEDFIRERPSALTRLS